MTGAALTLLGHIARHGRAALIVGLVAGLALPNLALALKPWLPALVLALLFLVAVRVGPTHARSGLANLRGTLILVVSLQLGLPLCVIAIAKAFDAAQSVYVLAAVLVFAAPALSGSPSLAIILGADPEPAFRILILGTLLLPLTVLPIFWLLPQFGDLGTAAQMALRALLGIVCAMGLGFTLRAHVMPNPSHAQSQALDGVMTIAMTVIVIGLMAALRPALAQSLSTVAIWMTLAFALNMGTQVLCFLVLRRILRPHERVPVAIVSGNRNIAIFLLALSPATAEPLLIFLGCYQVPMYLTPLLMDRIYRSARSIQEPR